MSATLKSYKSSKIKLFVVFLSLATFFWMLTKFSKDQTSTVSFYLIYQNLPPNALLANGNEDEVSVDIRANGFELMFYRLKKPTIDIDVSKYYIQNTNTAVIVKSELLKMITPQIDRSASISNLSIDELQVKLDVVTSKLIEVKGIMNVSFKQGYKQKGLIKIEPDSVLVSGASHAIDSIQFIETEELVVENAESGIMQEINLQTANYQDVTIHPKVVQVHLDIKEFTQKELTLAIDIINLPEGVTIKLIPEVSTIRFDVSVDDFKNTIENEFRLVCDYAERNEEENFIIPRLLNQPEHVLNIEIVEKKIDFLIFK